MFIITIMDFIDEINPLIKDKVIEIVKVWIDIGVEDEKLCRRKESMQKYILNLLDDMLKEELGHKADLLNSIDCLKTKIFDLCKQLELECNFPIENSLVKLEKNLDSNFTYLESVKSSRLEKYEKLTEEERILYEKLSEDRPYMKLDKLPTERLLKLKEENIVRLNNIKNCRAELYINKRRKILDALSELELDISNDGMVGVINEDKNGSIVQLSTTFLNECDSLIRGFTEQMDKNQMKLFEIRRRHAALMQMPIFANITNEFDISKFASNFGYKTIDKIQHILQKMEDIRVAKRKDIITDYRNKIRTALTSSLMEHAINEEPYRSMLNSTEVSDAVMSYLEEQYNEVHSLELSAAVLINDIRHWEETTVRLAELCQKMKDPNILKNRGGILLRVEKEKKLAEKDVKKVENNIRNSLAGIDPKFNLHVNGVPIRDYVGIGDDKENDRSKLKGSQSRLDVARIGDQKTILSTRNVIPAMTTSMTATTSAVTLKSGASEFKKPMLPSATVSALPKPRHIPGPSRIPQCLPMPTTAAKGISELPKTNLNRRMSRSCNSIAEPEKKDKMKLAYKLFIKGANSGAVTSSFYHEY